MATKNEDQWDERFGGTQENAAGSNMFETFGEDLAAVQAADEKLVWSVIEGDNDNQYLLPGFHVVNLMGYVLAIKPITDEELASGEWDEVLWFDGAEMNRLDDENEDFDDRGPRF